MTDFVNVFAWCDGIYINKVIDIFQKLSSDSKLLNGSVYRRDNQRETGLHVSD